MKNTLWILVANASEAKIFAAQHINQDWELIKEFTHPESREKGIDLISDRMGRFEIKGRAPGVIHGSFDEPTLPKEMEAERFAHQLAEALNSGRTSNQFHELILVAPPHFHGLLNKYVNQFVSNMVKKHIPKDYTKLKGKELTSQLRLEM